MRAQEEYGKRISRHMMRKLTYAEAATIVEEYWPTRRIPQEEPYTIKERQLIKNIQDGIVTALIAHAIENRERPQ